MHDTLSFMSRDPIHRSWHPHELTFGLLYAFSERFVLPLSHDEVVHGKGSLLGKMPGDPWRRLANLRAYLAFMWTHPGKKLLFMGGEIAQPSEWNHDGEIPWDLLDQPGHAGVQALVRDLNRLYQDEPALHLSDADPAGFAWLMVDGAASIFAYLRRAHDGAPPVLVALNLTPEPRHGVTLGAPAPGVWREVFNSDGALYGGANIGNGGAITADPRPAGDQPCSLQVTLPPIGAVVLRHDGDDR